MAQIPVQAAPGGAALTNLVITAHLITRTEENLKGEPAKLVLIKTSLQSVTAAGPILKQKTHRTKTNYYHVWSVSMEVLTTLIGLPNHQGTVVTAPEGKDQAMVTAPTTTGRAETAPLATAHVVIAHITTGHKVTALHAGMMATTEDQKDPRGILITEVMVKEIDRPGLAMATDVTGILMGNAAKGQVDLTGKDPRVTDHIMTGHAVIAPMVTDPRVTDHPAGNLATVKTATTALLARR